MTLLDKLQADINLDAALVRLLAGEISHVDCAELARLRKIEAAAITYIGKDRSAYDNTTAYSQLISAVYPANTPPHSAQRLA